MVHLLNIFVWIWWSTFSLATDGSNDSGLKKMNPLTVRNFYVNQGRVVSQVLDMCLTSSSTAEAIFTKINKISWLVLVLIIRMSIWGSGIQSKLKFKSTL